MLPALADEVFTVGKLSVGYTRHLPAVAMFVVGGALLFSVIPDDLKPYYSHRVPVGFIVFINIRPTAMPMMPPGHDMASVLATP